MCSGPTLRVTGTLFEDMVRNAGALDSAEPVMGNTERGGEEETQASFVLRAVCMLRRGGQHDEEGQQKQLSATWQWVPSIQHSFQFTSLFLSFFN